MKHSKYFLGLFTNIDEQCESTDCESCMIIHTNKNTQTTASNTAAAFPIKVHMRREGLTSAIASVVSAAATDTYLANKLTRWRFRLGVHLHSGMPRIRVTQQFISE